jgi:DNA-binding transcriptional MerR regulator
MGLKLTVDELAQRSGLPTSTLRLYRQRGLLPPPTLEGRVGYFDDAHVARLQQIGELRERGFSLAAIKDLLDGWESGRGLGEVLGLARVEGPTDVEVVDRAVLTRRFPELDTNPALWEQLAELDLAHARAGDQIAVNSGFLPMVDIIAAFGIPLGVMLAEFATVDAFTNTAAARFVELFEQYVLADVPAIDADALAAMIGSLRAVATQVITGALERAIDRAAADAVARVADGGSGATSVN